MHVRGLTTVCCIDQDEVNVRQFTLRRPVRGSPSKLCVARTASAGQTPLDPSDPGRPGGVGHSTYDRRHTGPFTTAPWARRPFGLRVELAPGRTPTPRREGRPRPYAVFD